jgi:hypothetical protein
MSRVSSERADGFDSNRFASLVGSSVVIYLIKNPSRNFEISDCVSSRAQWTVLNLGYIFK